MNLLKTLSGRLYKENNLSDILWAYTNKILQETQKMGPVDEYVDRL